MDPIAVFIQSCDLRGAASSSKCQFTSQKMGSMMLSFFCYILLGSTVIAGEKKNDTRPYEFSFNIVDFQHRYEKKDADGIITGEYGFITADGVYHETGYATDKNGDFIITRMRNRRITSLKDAQEIFKDRPEAAKKLVEAVAKACGGCKIPIKQDPDDHTQSAPTVTSAPGTKVDSVFREMMKILAKSTKDGGETAKGKFFQDKNKIPESLKEVSNERRGKSLRDGIVTNMVESAKKFLKKEAAANPNLKSMITNDRVLEKMANDLFYRFNYTITTHEHQEDGYKDGKKDGSYRAQSENGVDTRVKYLANEFGHQPNISFVPRANVTESHRLKGYSFLWYWP